MIPAATGCRFPLLHPEHRGPTLGGQPAGPPHSTWTPRRNQQVVEAYLSGLETCPGDLSGVHSVASLSLSQVDAEVNGSLFARRGPGVPQLQGRAAVAQARLAYRAFCDRFSGPRWETLAARGAGPSHGRRL